MTKRQKTTRRIQIAVLVLLIPVVVVGWTARSGSTAADDGAAAGTSTKRLPVEVVRVSPVGEITRKRAFTGNLKAARESKLSFERPGKLISVMVDEGDRVEQGQLLASVDVDHVATQLSSVQAQLEQARAVLAELAKGPRRETIDSQRAQVNSLSAEVKRLQLNFDRSKQLVTTAAISRERFDQTQYQLESAISRRDAAQRQLDELLAGTRSEKLDAQRAAVKQLQAEIRTLELDLADGRLEAPFSGRIAERLLDEGTVVATGEPVFRLVEDDRLEAWIGVPPSAALRLELGRTYSASVGGRDVDVTLASLRPSLDAITRTQNAVFKLDESAATGLVPGQIIRLSLDEQIHAEGYVLPTRALVPGPRGLWNVYVVSDVHGQNTVEQRNVEMLYSLGENSFVNGTLREGDAVIVDGVHRVVSGQAVAPVETKPEVIR